jgi:translation initiation factor RLI1
MSKRFAMIDYESCHPERCDKGVCAALSACSHPDEILVQEAPGDYPYVMQDLCLGCGDCSRACPLEAIRMTG